MRSFLILSIVISLLVFAIACGITGNQDGGSTDSSAGSGQDRSGDPGRQDALEDNEKVEGGLGKDSESVSGEDNSRQGGDKSVTVRFSKGSTSGTYKDTVYNGAKHVYRFGVVQSQSISAKINSGDGSAYFSVFDPAGKRIGTSGDRERNFSGSVPESGNYRIEVMTSGDRSDYTVTFGASALPSDDEEVQSGGLTKTVRFAKGRSSASYSGAVIRGDRDTYVLRAGGGQQMSVSVTSVEDNAVFQVRGPGGYLQGAEPGSDRTSWSGRLPADGTYRVIVGGTRGNATYKLTISIR